MNIKVGDKLECIYVGNLRITNGISVGDIVTVNTVEEPNYIFIFTPKSQTINRACLADDLSKHFKHYKEPEMNIFKIGDKVKCLTDKYKMLNEGDTDIVHALENNGFIRLLNSKRYKYKEKYFKLVLEDKKEEEIPVAKVHKNPFKFTSTKPEYKALYSKLKNTYSSSIGEYTPSDIHKLLFFHLSKGNWEESKIALLSESNLKSALKQTAVSLNWNHKVFNDLDKYYNFIPNTHGVTRELYIIFLCSYDNIQMFKKVFDIDVIDKATTELITSSNFTSLSRIKQRVYILENFSKHTMIKPINNGDKTFVNAKEELEESIFTAILEGKEVIQEFQLGLSPIPKTNSDGTPNVPEDQLPDSRGGWIPWASDGSKPDLPKGTKILVELNGDRDRNTKPDYVNIWSWDAIGPSKITAYKIVEEEVPF